MAEKVLEIINDRAQQKIIAKNGYDCYLANFSSKPFYKKLNNIFG
jgi:hypothetical protein